MKFFYLSYVPHFSQSAQYNVKSTFWHIVSFPLFERWGCFFLLLLLLLVFTFHSIAFLCLGQTIKIYHFFIYMFRPEEICLAPKVNKIYFFLCDEGLFNLFDNYSLNKNLLFI